MGIGDIADHLSIHAERYVIAALLVGVGSCGFYMYGPHSRRTLNPIGKTIECNLPPDFDKMVNVSSGGSIGDVMITYETIEGKLVTQEVNRSGLWETRIEWSKAPEAEKSQK